jgi:hypothetical protein
MDTDNGGNLSLTLPGFIQCVNLVSLLLGKLCVVFHRCFSLLAEGKAVMLPQLAFPFELLSCTYELDPPLLTPQRQLKTIDLNNFCEALHD